MSVSTNSPAAGEPSTGMRADGFENLLASKVIGYVYRHAVVGIGLPVLRIPQMMRHEFEQQRFWRRQGVRTCRLIRAAVIIKMTWKSHQPIIRACR